MTDSNHGDTDQDWQAICAEHGPIGQPGRRFGATVDSVEHRLRCHAETHIEAVDPSEDDGD